jgi:hypothetical protein
MKYLYLIMFHELILLTKEIIKTGEVFTDREGKKWMPVNISFIAVSQINKILLGDNVDKDDFKALAKRRDVQEDCLELFDLFK